MYIAFHNLTKKPFSMTADPSFLFLTKQHREALAGLMYAVLDRKGFLVLSGMSGSGKTTLLAWLLDKLPRDKVRSSVIVNPTLTREEFLELAMLDFGIPDIPVSKAQRLWKLQNFLLANAKEGKVNVLIVDEAHKLSYELLEEIRLLGNLECGEEKLLQILLLGQSELDGLLSRPDLWQLKQRVGVRLAIGSLAPNEVEYYIQHRWTVAGGATHPFTPQAVEHINRWSKGIPRLINALCDASLTLAFADEQRSVNAGHVDSAAGDLLLMDKPAAPRPAPTPAMPLPAAAPASSPAVAPPAPSVSTASAEPPKASPPPAASPAKPPVAQFAATQGRPAPGPMKVLESYAPRPTKRWSLARWADRLGFNGNGHAKQ